MRVLIAEDDPNILAGLQTLLDAEGYSTDGHSNGESALNALRTQEFDLALLDIMMPKLDGYEVCRQIRKTNEELPVIFISAKSEEIDRVVGLELGADDFIAKPFGVREVVARIRAVTRRTLTAKNAHATQSFVMHDLEVLPDELRAKRDHRAIDLSLRDVAILKLLYEQRGKVVSRDDMFNAAWGRDYLASSRTLDQHISKLRKLIEVDPTTPRIIKTVHGSGYRYEP